MGEGRWQVHGRGLGGLAEPDRPLDLGNSGTAARLLLGVLAGHPFTSFMTGDASLNRRPMGRVSGRCARWARAFVTRSGERLPLAITGSNELLPIRYEQPVASAQVKSAVLLAGLHAAGRTTVVEPAPSRDHTERLLGQLGAEVEVASEPDGRRAVSVQGQPELEAFELTVPGDISSAAFPLVAAAALAGSRAAPRGRRPQSRCAPACSTACRRWAPRSRSAPPPTTAASRCPGSRSRAGRSPASRCPPGARRA